MVPLVLILSNGTDVESRVQVDEGNDNSEMKDNDDCNQEDDELFEIG